MNKDRLSNLKLALFPWIVLFIVLLIFQVLRLAQ